jgi:hypothetical protein
MNDEIQEIDLLALFIRLFKFIKKQFFLLLGIAAIGAAAGAAMYILTPEKHQYKLIGYSPIGENKVINTAISDLSYMINGNELPALSKKLDIPVETLQNVTSIESVIDEDNNNRLSITITVSTPIDKEQVSALLTNYIASNDYLAQKLNIKKSQIKNTINFIDKQIDTYKNEHIAQEGTSLYVNNSETPTSLFIKKNSYEEQLAFLSPFVITHFPEKPTNPQSSILIYFLGGGFLGIIILIMAFSLKKINLLADKMATPKLSKLGSFSKTA